MSGGMEAGPQPLDVRMTERGLKNRDLATASREHLTCKQVQKRRKGRHLTRNLQSKILNAFNACIAPDTVTRDQLFNYRGR